MDYKGCLDGLLNELSTKYKTKALIAEAIGVKYVTVAHWFDGRSTPNFETTMQIMDVLGYELPQGK